VCWSCADDPPPPAVAPAGPFFNDAFDDDAAMPRTWDEARGELTVAAIANAPSGGRALQARSAAPRKEALLHKTLKPNAAIKKLTCRATINLTKIGGPNPVGVMRIDVAGGYVLVDLKADAWNAFGRFGGQEFSQGKSLEITNRWLTVVVALENTGRIVVTFAGDERVEHIDVKRTPIDVKTSSIEVGLLAPPIDFDAEAAFDDVECRQE